MVNVQPKGGDMDTTEQMLPVRTTRYSYFTRHPYRSAGKVHASQGLAMEALCRWQYLNGSSDPAKSTVPMSLPKLLAEVTCATCVLEILKAEGFSRKAMVPNGCTGGFDSLGEFVHDGDTCPIHER